MRPKYERQEDLDHEQFIIALFPHLELNKVPYFYGYDFIGTWNKGKSCVIEYKKRTKPFHLMKDGAVILSLNKYTTCVAAPVYRKLFFVETPEGLFAVDMEKGVLCGRDNKPLITIGGRKDRGDPMDIEPIVTYPGSNFKKLINDRDLNEYRTEYKKCGSLSTKTLQRLHPLIYNRGSDGS
jgi:hypothetical protein